MYTNVFVHRRMHYKLNTNKSWQICIRTCRRYDGLASLLLWTSKGTSVWKLIVLYRFTIVANVWGERQLSHTWRFNSSTDPQQWRKATSCKKATTRDLRWKRLLSDGTNSDETIYMTSDSSAVVQCMVDVNDVTMKDNRRFQMTEERTLLEMKTNQLPLATTALQLETTALPLATSRCRWRRRVVVDDGASASTLLTLSLATIN